MSNRDQQSALEGARDAEPRAGGAPIAGQALQDQIGQALQPAMAELRERITASVRHELDEKLHNEGRRSKPRAEGDQGRSNEAAEPPAMASPEMGRALQDQISQALQPAMTEFREQMAATVRRELDETLHRDGRRAPADAGRARNRGHGDEQAAAAEGEDQSADEARSKNADPAGERGSRAIRPLLGKPLREALPEILEQQGEQWLRSRLDQGIDFAFSAWVRAAVQREVERVLQRLARVAIEIIPDRATRDDLRAQSEQTVESLVSTALDKLFAEDVREDLKARGHQAIDALFRPDLKSIVHQLQELLVSLLEGLLAALRETWEQILQFVTRMVVALLQTRLTAMLKDTFASLAATPGREGDRRGADSSTALEREEVEPRQTSTEPEEDSSLDGAREHGRSHQRVRESERSADSSGGGSDRRPGQASSGRPPVGRPPAARQPSGRPSSDRSAPGRPSRAGMR